MTKIAIIVGSTRPGRYSEGVARWVLEQASPRDDATFELVDLADYPLPHLDEPIPASAGRYENEHTRRWSQAVAEYDGYIFVTPEYNHSTTGVLKNAIDYLYAEWANKAAGFVSYGVVGGSRAVEHLRLIAAELQLATVRGQVALSFFHDFENFTTLKPEERQHQALTELLDQLVAWSGALAPLRAARSPASA
ncbi:NAD(P)H-dependent oxidoreductase [Frankia sp. CNm7]|uniref:NAD(P)H-dependent oxidoreductase n=1 Tax=Frankia nepalensis TaxID=1836974 RepID=A0A937RLQ8_9ACTN|nr:NAD(P)H-dependent oxidoreductase [Frankia nepalensis]MBL7502317.1 NAD(P)H-dependent oxidoreductase [Frankia nepalensis]MBL7514402.1 NAD(P)H-dependent oxidoreductase [Frankia nepalensis]MBL7518851.1 NAD(P)H-dependent oxidoreductase [Frankia nepalensis]MBL7632570.1 NAD(P)H-dependent oxidoreductase [Frankia nepalensis]